MSAYEHIALEELTSFALGAINQTEAASLSRHIRICSHCQGELAETWENLGLYGRLTTLHEVGEERRARMLDRVAREKRQISSPWPINVDFSGKDTAHLKAGRKKNESLSAEGWSH